MSCELVEAMLMHRHMGKCHKLGYNMHVFTAGNNDVEGSLKESASMCIQVI